MEDAMSVTEIQKTGFPVAILLLTYKTVSDYALSYIEDLLDHYVPSCR